MGKSASRTRPAVAHDEVLVSTLRAHHEQSILRCGLPADRRAARGVDDIAQHRRLLGHACVPAWQLPQLLHATEQPLRSRDARRRALAHHAPRLGPLRIYARRRRAVHADHRDRPCTAARATRRAASRHAGRQQLGTAPDRAVRDAVRLAVHGTALADPSPQRIRVARFPDRSSISAIRSCAARRRTGIPARSSIRGRTAICRSRSSAR